MSRDWDSLRRWILSKWDGLWAANPKKRAETPLPLAKMGVLMCILMSESVGITYLFPFVPFMVAWFDITDDPKQIGSYAGLIASSFMISQFCSSFFWGRLSDRHGKRRILLFGLIGNIATTLWFGFATTLPSAMGARAVCGLLNGNVGVAKSYVSAITDETNQAKGFSVVAFCWGAGVLVGPVVGGLLAQPADNYPALFPRGSLFDQYPFLLPALCTCSISVVGLIVGFFRLTEPTTPTTIQEDRATLKDSLSSEEGGGGVAVPLPVATEDGRPLRAQPIKREAQSVVVWWRSLLASTLGGGRLSRYRDLEKGQVNEVELQETPKQGRELLEESSQQLQGVTEGDAHSNERDEATKVEVEMGNTHIQETGRRDEAMEMEVNEITKPQVLSVMQILRSKDSLFSISAYCLIRFAAITFDESFTLLAATSTEMNGFGFTTAEIGQLMMTGGISLLVFQGLIYHRLANRFGPRFCSRLGSFIAIFSMFFVPWFSGISDVTQLKFALTSIIVLRTFSLSCSFTSVFLMINNSVPRSSVGTVNGLAQSLASLTSAVAPTVAGVGFTWSLSNGLPFPFDYHFNFSMASVYCLIQFSCLMVLSVAVNKRRTS